MSGAILIPMGKRSYLYFPQGNMIVYNLWASASDVSPGDCTHKGVDVIIEFNRQLFRTVERVHSYEGIQK
jgi:hypothetical protein